MENKILFKKYSIGFIVLLLFALMSCSSKRYIKDLPYLFPIEQSNKELSLRKNYNDFLINDSYNDEEKINERELDIKERYSITMGVTPKKVTNYRLYSFIDQWIKTGGETTQSFNNEKQEGCGSFVSLLFNEVYNETISPVPEKVFTSKSIELFTGRNFLKEGDIIFFRYDKLHPISDEAIYLQNNKIIACTTTGLNIYDFNNEYFQLRYIAAGRLRSKNN